MKHLIKSAQSMYEYREQAIKIQLTFNTTPPKNTCIFVLF